MERKIEIPDVREEEEDSAPMENSEGAASVGPLSSSEEWEKISEDWVSLFLDPAILDDDNSRSYSQFESEPNDHFTSQELLADSSLLLNDQLSLGTSSNVVEDLFGKEDPKTCPKTEPVGASSPASSLTQASGGSSSPAEVSSTPPLQCEEADSLRHLPSKVGLLGISEDRKVELSVAEDQQSDHSDGDRKGGDEDDEKRRARLMRNRESAQLSRQRKKVYVDELEGKLRTMASTVAELNTTISHLTAENVTLRRQLGYYYPAPGVVPRPGMPMHVMPMGPYPGMVAGRPMFPPGGQMPPVPIPRMKTQQTPARSAKRPKSGTAKEGGGDKKRTKLKAAGAASMAVMGLLCVAMLFGSIDQGINGSVDDYTHVRVGGRVLTSLNEGLNVSGLSSWRPLEPGEYGPEREGVPSVHTQFENEKLQGIRTGNAMLSPFLVPESDMVPSNASQSFAASVFVPGANGLVKVDGNLIIQAVMAGDNAAKKQSQKKHKSGSKKKKKKKEPKVKSLFVKALEKLPAKSLKNATIGPFVTARPLSANVKPVVGGSNNSVSPVLRAGSLQQWMLGGLHDPETSFVASELTKKSRSQVDVDNSKAVAATFYGFTPHDTAPRGPLHSWLYSGLSTEPIMCERNISGDNVKETVTPLPMRNEERFDPSAYKKVFQKATHKADNTCSVPTLSPVLNTGMCTELFQFDTTSSTSSSPPEAKTMAESVAAKAAAHHNVTAASTLVHHNGTASTLVPRSRRDPFAVPLPPIKPKPTSQEETKRTNGTDPRVEKTVREQMHGVSSMVVSVMAGPEEYERHKGGLSRIFVVVLVDNQKYVTYSCMLPSGGPQAHVVAE